MFRLLSFDISRKTSPTNDETKDITSAEIIEIFGQTYNWLDGRHYSAAELEQYRFIGDIELDRILELNSSNDGVSGGFSNTIQACAEIYHREEKILQNNESNHCLSGLSSEDLAMYEFYKHYHDYIPNWVDWDQIQRGIDVFILYSPAAGQALYYLSLVPGFSIPKIAKVLQQTKYLVPPSTSTQVQNRLMDTGGFISNVFLPSEGSELSASSIRPGQKAWTMALQVRTLHAKIRRAIQTNKQIQWNSEEYGIPINQEDMAATLLAFSVNVLIGIEFVAGKSISDDEQRDYIALWRYLGWLLGIESNESESTITEVFSNKTCSGLTPLDPCGSRDNGKYNDDSIIHANATLESIVTHLMQPDKYSGEVARHLLTIGRNSTIGQASTEKIPYLYRSYMCRRFVGDPLANALQLPRPNYTIKSLVAYALTTFVLLLLRIYSLLTMQSSWFRTKAYARHLALILKFDRMWSTSHGKRMDKAAHDAMKNTHLSHGSNGGSSSCPFALVMPPKPTDCHSKLE